MTRADRDAAAGAVKGAGFHGAAYGDGIYVADNAHGFKAYGDTGLICAVLRGNEEKFNQKSHGVRHMYRPYSKKSVQHSRALDDLGSVIGNKGGGVGGTYYDEIVLQRSSQIIPCFKYSTSLLKDQAGEDLVWQFADSLNKLLNEVINDTPNNSHVRIQPLHAPVRPAPIPVLQNLGVGIGFGGFQLPSALVG